MDWRSLRKTGSSVHLSYRGTFSNNLVATAFQFRTSPEFELRFDLNSNLHTRSRTSNRYSDARELADGAIRQLEMVQLDEPQITSQLAQAVIGLREQPTSWTLTILLDDREYRFRVEPEPQAGSISLKVLAMK